MFKDEEGETRRISLKFLSVRSIQNFSESVKV